MSRVGENAPLERLEWTGANFGTGAGLLTEHANSRHGEAGKHAKNTSGTYVRTSSRHVYMPGCSAELYRGEHKLDAAVSAAREAHEEAVGRVETAQAALMKVRRVGLNQNSLVR